MSKSVNYLDFQEEKALMSPKFQSFVKNTVAKKPIVMFVTAAWCGHCVHFKEALAKTNLTKNIDVGANPGAVIAHFSDVTAGHLMKFHEQNILGHVLVKQVQGYPAVFAITAATDKNNIGVYHFNEERTPDNINKFVKAAATLDGKTKKRKPAAAKKTRATKSR